MRLLGHKASDNALILLNASRRRDGLYHYGYHLGWLLLWCHPKCWHRQDRDGVTTAAGGATEVTAVLALSEAEQLAAATLASINSAPIGARWPGHADRERVESDLAGLRDCWAVFAPPAPGSHNEGHARRYSDGLRRTAALYGVTA